MPKDNLFVVVDGSSYLFRAFHALPPLTNFTGEPTGAIVGVINMLNKLLSEHPPTHVAVVFDAPGKTFRNDLYPEYKAHRPPMPDDLRVQIEPLQQIIRDMGLPLLIESGVEADDVIGTLAAEATRIGMQTLISTGDKDLMQLVNEHVTLINTMGDIRTNVQGVMDKFGVRPEQIIDFLALVGDTADNIPGVSKCGPKTAAKWLAQYQTLENLIEHADEIKGKIGENLRASLEQLPLSKQLTTIVVDLPLGVTAQQLQQTPPDREALRNHFERIESSRLLASLDRQSEDAVAEELPQETIDDVDYQTILEQQQFEQWLERLETAELITLDTETTSLDYMQAELVGLSFALEPGEACYIPVAHKDLEAPQQLDRDAVLQRLKPILEDAARPKLGQHLKYDMNVLARYDIDLQGVVYDTMLESYILNSTATRHDMDSLAKKYLGYTTIKFEDVAGKGAKQITFDQVPLQQAAPYAAEDADVPLRLHRRLWGELQQESALRCVFEEIEIPLVPVLSRIERTGVKIDSAMLARQSSELAKRMHLLESKAYEVAGHTFNMGSPKQIGAIFFEELGMPIVSKTPKGAPSTAESVLQKLAEDGFELPAVILEHRGLAKLRSTYTEKLPLMIDKDTGRVHTSYHQAIAATGRLSSSDPNLQNIPVRSQDGRRIRQAFVPEAGYRMVAADYSQIELRIMAHLSADETLLKAFSEGRDIHTATAAEVFGREISDVTVDQRRSAKAINFGLIYGMSAFGLAKQLDVERGVAQEYIDLYFERYPGVQRFMDQIRAQAHDDGYVETIFGRRLYLPEINARNGQRRAAAERTAINAPMQGSAADIIKRAMLAVDAWIQRERPPLRMIMQVHDELVFEIREDELQSSIDTIQQLMESAADLDVPLVVDVGIGANWDEAH